MSMDVWRVAVLSIGLGLSGWMGGCAASQRPVALEGDQPVMEQIARAYGRDYWQAVETVHFYLAARENGVEVARFSHLWDRRTGDYRYEADASAFAAAPMLDDATGTWQPIALELPAGRLVALVNLESGQGEVYIDGQPQDPKLVRRVIERIQNDLFILLQPLEIDDAAKDGKLYDIRLKDGTPARVYRFHYAESAGITGEDQWAVFYDPATLHVLATKVKPQNQTRVVTMKWGRHAEINGVTFSLERVMGDKSITFEGLTMPGALPREVFTDPFTDMY
jgi:hypothetical protein